MIEVTIGEHLDSLAFGFDSMILLMAPAHDTSTLALVLSNKESFGFLSLVVLDGSPSSLCSVVFSSSPLVFCFLGDIPSPTLLVNRLGFDALFFSSQPTEPAVFMVGTDSVRFMVIWW